MASRRFFDGAQVEIGSLPIEGAAVQTVTLNRVESTATVYNPTVSRQASNVIALTLVASAAQVFLPTVVQAGGTQTVTLNRIESTAQVFAPTVALQGSNQDTSDILDRGLRRLRREEESVAAQILKDRNKKVKREEKTKLDWKKAILDKINGAQEVEQLDAINLPTESVEVTAQILAELERKKEAKRIELEIARKEAELKVLELKKAVEANEVEIARQIAEKQAVIESFKRIQEDVLARHEIAMKQALEEEQKLFLDTLKAEKEAEEFTRKRNNRIKRIKALMWLAKLDL